MWRNSRNLDLSSLDGSNAAQSAPTKKTARRMQERRTAFVTTLRGRETGGDRSSEKSTTRARARFPLRRAKVGFQPGYHTEAIISEDPASVARFFVLLFAPADAQGPPPVFVSVPPGLAVDLILVAAMTYDWRTRGRPHPVYLIGGALLLANQLLAVPISSTPTWLSIAHWVESLAG